MFDPINLILISLAYMALLFVVAAIGVRWKRLQASPWVYALSIAVYCTSWTFYGSVGSASISGYGFLTIHLGSCLAIVFGGVIITKILDAKSSYKITSIADLISVRYKHSQGISALVTIICLAGIVPYIGLQIKSILITFNVATSVDSAPFSESTRGWLSFLFVVLLSSFTVLFGVRKLDPTERHPGIIFVLAIECILKLVALIAVGIFVSYGMFDGIGDIFQRLEEAAKSGAISNKLNQTPDLSRWVSMMILSMSAVIFLPHMFQVLIVENSNRRQLKTAQWLFPSYQIAINFFVIPIAAAGLLMGYSSLNADTFVLLLPIGSQKSMLSLFVFLGGFSASIGMIAIAAMAIATMASNHLLLPIAEYFPRLHGLRKNLLLCRQIVVFLLMTIAYGFYRAIGESFMLINIGIFSFIATLQFAPIIIGGLFWRRGTLKGAFAGLSAGFFMWLYCCIFPAIIKSGWLDVSIIEYGPWGISAFKPEALFGLSGLDNIAHAVFWSLFFNIFFYICYSLFFDADEEEQQITENFFLASKGDLKVGKQLPKCIDARKKINIIYKLLDQYLPRKLSYQYAHDCFTRNNLDTKSNIDLIELTNVRQSLQRLLSGSIGTAAAHQAIKSSVLMTKEETFQLRSIYTDVLSELSIPPAELLERVNYYQEREKLLREQLEMDRKAEKAEIASKAKSEFLAVMSHEIRTPMNGVLGIAELMKDTHLDAKQKEYLDAIYFSAESLLTVINDILDYSKLEAGKLTIESIPYDLHHLLKDIAHIFVNQAKEGEVKFSTEIAEGTPSQVIGDPNRVRQVVVNLIGNSFKFTEQGYIKLSVSADDEYLYFTVEDSGIGITDEQKQKVYTPFEQADSSTSRKYGGTGLGLSICKKLVDQMGGEITIEDVVSGGTRMTFTVKRINQPLGEVDNSCTPLGQKTCMDYSYLNVLVAEDNSVNQMVIRGLLKKLSVEPSMAATGVEAVKFVTESQRPFDLILMDCEMPEMDGYEATQNIRLFEQEQQLKPIVIIALSAHALVDRRNKALECGMNDYLTKPLKLEDLTNMLKLHFDNSLVAINEVKSK